MRSSSWGIPTGLDRLAGTTHPTLVADGGAVTDLDPDEERIYDALYTLKRNSTTSPSRMT
ncbi:MAG: hypothetical protein ACJ74O_17045 [Frankiaceae bacterium]